MAKTPRATTKTWNSQINIFIKINKYLLIFKKDLVPPRQRTPVPFLVGKLRFPHAVWLTPSKEEKANRRRAK